MKKITRVDMAKYGCRYCRFHADRWTCSLDECILLGEERPRGGQPARAERPPHREVAR